MKKDAFARPWNIAQKTWLEVAVPGPWAVCNSLPSSWAIINTKDGRSKKIGPVTMRGTNYFDRAQEEANRRNLALLCKFEITDELARKIIADNPKFVSGDDSHADIKDAARMVVDRMRDEVGCEFPGEHPEHRDALLGKLSSYNGLGLNS